MKEKVTMFLTLTSIFSLFLYYKINPNIENQVLKVDNPSQTEYMESTEIIYETEVIVVPELNQEPSCRMEEKETDELMFSDAFKYYRSCLEGEEAFTWNGKRYTTFLKDEGMNQGTELAIKEIPVSNQLTIDKTHIQLQNEMFGNSSNQ